MKKLNRITGNLKCATRGTLMILTIAWTIIILASCSKPSSKGIYFQIDGRQMFYENVQFTSQPYCGTQKIFSYSSGNLLVSFVADSVQGIHQGGMNLWGNMTESIIINLKSVNIGSWSGERTKGQINI